MAKNDFKVFNETGTNQLTQAEYEADAQRISGVASGLARSSLFNKALHQASTMAAALGQVLFSKGIDATDDDYIQLAEKLAGSFSGQLVYYALSDINPTYTEDTPLRTVLTAMEINSELKCNITKVTSDYPQIGVLQIAKTANDTAIMTLSGVKNYKVYVNPQNINTIFS